MTDTKWFKDAKYGLFVHWGLYSILGGVWQGERAPHTAEWIMKNMQIPLSEYKKLANEFNPKSFNAQEYVRLAKKWGMKYIVVTAKHHDGFSMYNTAYSDYKITNTPYGKDIIKQFADACEEQNMIFCVYYSQMQDWEHPDGNGNNWDFDPAKKDFKKYFYEKCIPQVKELLTNYGKIGLIWFDTPYDMPKELCRELGKTVKEIQPSCLINGRIGYSLGDYRQMADNSIPHCTFGGAWEVPMTMNATWGYSSFDKGFCNASKIIERLSLVASKGGNLLLNIGPDADGNIPNECTDTLDRVGEWLEINRESIYNTEALPDFPYDIPWGNITYNRELERLYFHIKSYPTLTPKVQVIGIKNKVLGAHLLCDGRELKITQSYEQARDENRFGIYLPTQCPDETDTVAVVQIQGTPDIQKLI